MVTLLNTVYFVFALIVTTLLMISQPSPVSSVVFALLHSLLLSVLLERELFFSCYYPLIPTLTYRQCDVCPGYPGTRLSVIPKISHFRTLTSSTSQVGGCVLVPIKLERQKWSSLYTSLMS